jgi:aminomethyltransferase
VPEPTSNNTDVAERPLRLSPLHATHLALGARFVSQSGWEVPHAYASPEEEARAVRERVGVADVSSLGKLLVRGDAKASMRLLGDAFGVGPIELGCIAQNAAEDGTDSFGGLQYLARLTADEFLVVTSPGAEAAVARQIEAGREAEGFFLTVVDQTSGLAGLSVVGPQGREVLSKLWALPLDARDFPDRRVSQSSLAKVHTVIVRNDLDELPAFELYFERPYAEYVWNSIRDAGDEFGLLPVGWAAFADMDTRFLG